MTGSVSLVACSSTSTLNVNVSPSTLALTGSSAVCPSSTPYTYTNTVGGSPQWYVSNPPLNSLSAVNANTVDVQWGTLFVGTQTLGVTNGGGCTATKAVTVSQGPFAVPIYGPATVCQGNSATYTTDPGNNNYSWGVDGGSVSSGSFTSNSVTVSWNTAGSKTVTLSYQDTHGCAAMGG